MKYETKIIVKDSYEITSTPDNNGSPFISGVVLHEESSINDRLNIGGTPMSMLEFKIHNTPTMELDGLKVQLLCKQVREEMESMTGITIPEDLSGFTDYTEDAEHNTTSTDLSEAERNAIIESFGADTIEGTLETEYATNYGDDSITMVTSSDQSGLQENENYRNEETTSSVQPVDPATSTDDWHSMGVFFISSIQSFDGYVSITAYDAFSKMQDEFIPDDRNTTISALYADFSGKMSDIGLSVHEEEFPAESINWNYSCTMREAAGWFAAMAGGFARFDRFGDLDIRTYLQNTSYDIHYRTFTDEGLQINSDGYITIDSVSCDIDPTVKEEWITVPEDAEPGPNQLKTECPYMTESMLESILELYDAVYYMPASLSCNWFLQMEYGDIVNVINEELEDVKICISDLIIYFDSGNCLIRSNGGTFTREEATGKSTSDLKVIRAVEKAAATATNYITEDDTGALVISNDVGSGNVRIDSDSVDIRKGSNVLGTFGASGDYAGLYINNGNKQGNLTSVLCGVSRELTDDRRDISVMTPGSLEVTNNNETTEIIGGDITAKSLNVTGSITGNIFGNFAFTSETIATSKSVAAEGYTDGTLTISKSGYYPIGVIGNTVNTRYCVINRAYIDNRALGSGKLNWMIANHHSSAHTVTANVHVLWVKG